MRIEELLSLQHELIFLVIVWQEAASSSPKKKTIRIEEIQPLPEKKSLTKKDGLDHRPAPIRTRLSSLEKAPLQKSEIAAESKQQTVSSIHSAQALLQAASKEGVSPRDAANFVQSIVVLCESRLQGALPDYLERLQVMFASFMKKRTIKLWCQKTC